MKKTVTGIHAVKAVCRNYPDGVTALYAARTRKDDRLSEVRMLAARAGITVTELNRKELDAKHSGRVHQGIVAELVDTATGAMDQLKVSRIADLNVTDHPLILILDGVQDPHNLGACLRSADASGVSAVIIPKDGACGITDTVRRAAVGAAETVPLITVANLSRAIESLQGSGFWVYGADADGDVEYDQASFATASVIVCGAEGRGLRRLTREHCDQIVTIPLQGTVDSLNVSVATAIVLFEVRRQWRRTQQSS